MCTIKFPSPVKKFCKLLFSDFQIFLFCKFTKRATAQHCCMHDKQERTQVNLIPLTPLTAITNLDTQTNDNSHSLRICINYTHLPNQTIDNFFNVAGNYKD